MSDDDNKNNFVEKMINEMRSHLLNSSLSSQCIDCDHLRGSVYGPLCLLNLTNDDASNCDKYSPTDIFGMYFPKL